MPEKSSVATAPAPRFTVVMTACLRPAPEFATSLVRTDAALRMRDYLEGLHFWLHLPDPRINRIIFLENTAHPLDEPAALAARDNPQGRECEFLSFNANEIPAGLHYGYAEYHMIDVGLARSRLWPASDYLIKATGRYRFPDISRLLDRLPPGFLVAADTRENTRFTSKPYHFVTAPLLVARRDFFDRHIRTAYQRMHPPPPYYGQFIEDALYDALMPLRGQDGVVLRWPVNCDPAGVGANGDRYDTLRKRLLRLARAIGRRLIPNWWL